MEAPLSRLPALIYLVDDEGGVPREPELLCVRLELEINKADAAEDAEEEGGADDLEGVASDRRAESEENQTVHKVDLKNTDTADIGHCDQIGTRTNNGHKGIKCHFEPGIPNHNSHNIRFMSQGNTVAPACMVHGCMVNPLVWSTFGWSRTDLAFC